MYSLPQNIYMDNVSCAYTQT